VLLQAGGAGVDGWGRREGSTVGLAERCDEIVRLIDETLASVGTDPADPVAPVTASPLADPPVATPRRRLATVRPLRSP
jgi:hypothetical protein